MSSALPKRIIKETERLMTDPVSGISAKPHDDNLRYFDVTVDGPSQSPYEGGRFKLELFLPEDYPSKWIASLDLLISVILLTLCSSGST